MDVKTTMFVAGALVLAPVALADGEEPHADAMVLVDPAGKLVTGTVDFDAQLFTGFTRVYEAEFARFDIGGGVQVATTDEPGFNALASGNASLPAGYSTLGAGTSLTFDAGAITIGGATANLWYWDGAGGVDFVPATTSMTISKAPSAAFNATLDGSASSVPGFEIDVAALDGSAHQHLDLEIPNAQLVGDGIFLWSFTLSTSDGKQADPIFFVHKLGESLTEAQHEAAVDWVTVNVVPAPGGALLALAGLGGLACRRRA
ncbi:MAG: hypothetical protein Tsb0013_20560 [Phycisphaerales bacterium]